MEEIQGKKKGNGVLIVLLILVICCLAGYIVYDKVISKDNKEETPVEEIKKEEDEQVKEPEPEVVSFNREEVNEKLVQFEMAYMYTFGDDRLPDNIVYDQELLHGNKQRMFDFVWKYSNLLKVEDVKYHVTADGQEVTGAYAISMNAYSNLYQKILGEEFDGNYSVSDKYQFELKDNYIYGGLYTGVGLDGMVLKINSCTKLLDTYNVVIDVLYFDTDKEIDLLDSIKQFSVTSYDKKYIDYKLNLSVVKNDDIYMIDSFKAVKS